jgi:hypothetical protein
MKTKIITSLSLMLFMFVLTTSMTLVRKDNIELEIDNSPFLPHYDDNEWVYQNCIKKNSTTGKFFKKFL